MGTKDDVSPTGIRYEGRWENDRNTENAELFKAIIREAFDCVDVIIGHHLSYEKQEVLPDPKHPGKTYTETFVQEIPSADTLIFDHDIAAKLWGDQAPSVLTRLALADVTVRDRLLGELFYGRGKP